MAKHPGLALCILHWYLRFRQPMSRQLPKSLENDTARPCEKSLRKRLREEKARRWKVEHAKFVEEYNRVIALEGLVLEEWKSF